MIPQNDAYKIIVIISKHGWHGAEHVYAFLRESSEREKWEKYVASILWSIGKMLGGENYPFPVYTDYINGVVQDTRSSQDIVSGLIEKLSE